MRIFDQNGYGIEGGEFTDVEISAFSLGAADLDGDGFDDLYVMHQKTGTLAVYWGGEDGINPERKTEFGKAATVLAGAATSTTVGRQGYRHIGWRCNILKLRDKLVTFRSEDNYAVFESFDKDRNAHEELRIKVMEENIKEKKDWSIIFAGNGPMHAACGDLSGEGTYDIAISVATDSEAINDLLVLWESDNYDVDKATRIPLRAPRSLSIGKMDASGKNYLFVCLSGEDDNLDIQTPIYEFVGKEAKLVRTVLSHEPVRLITGKTYADGRYQMVVVNHEGERRLGQEEATVFLGGEDGYKADRCLKFPGSVATDLIMCDFDDDGKTDVLLVNCSENKPASVERESFLYFNGPDGFDVKNKRGYFNSEDSHGAAIGDFRHSGYLDIITGGIHSRELLIFEGGPNGFDYENPKVLILGPDPEKFIEDTKDMTRVEKSRFVRDNDAEICKNYGEVRWLLAADFNGDGYLDIFVGQVFGRRSMIFWGGPDGFSRDNCQELATEALDAATAADLDGDGYLDLICGGCYAEACSLPDEAGRFVIYWGGPNGYEEHRKSELPSFCITTITVQDFNNDGLLDIYGTAYNNGRFRDIDSKIYFQSEDRMFHIENHQNIFTNSGCGCLSGDFNGDGYIDLAVASHKKDGHHVCDSFIFWGGEDGINEQRFTALPSIGPHGMCSADIGNIMDRSDSEYYFSEGYEVPAGKKAVKASWVAENGKKTWVKIQLRCADSIDALEKAQWSESFESGSDISALNLKGFIQYKLELGATCGVGTPRVTEVTIEFE